MMIKVRVMGASLNTPYTIYREETRKVGGLCMRL